ncbi:MAG: hypothetical protein ACK47Y_06170, partial [Dolichospermum sp.]
MKPTTTHKNLDLLVRLKQETQRERWVALSLNPTYRIVCWDGSVKPTLAKGCAFAYTNIQKKDNAIIIQT